MLLLMVIRRKSKTNDFQYLDLTTGIPMFITTQMIFLTCDMPRRNQRLKRTISSTKVPPANALEDRGIHKVALADGWKMLWVRGSACTGKSAVAQPFGDS
jgi:hypothetical protein